ncbi:hypothetical protein RFI_36781, partial [Reticulomyxa filosa]
MQTTWSNLSVQKWIELIGRIDIINKNMLIASNSEYLYYENCNSIVIQSLTFNSWICALNIKRINMTITQCKFNKKNVATSREMLQIYNVITVDKSNFTNAYFNISLGASQTSVSNNPNIIVFARLGFEFDTKLL